MSLITGPGSRYALGLIILALVSIYGLYLILAALNKRPVSIKTITLSLRGQIFFGLLLQAPCLIYIWLGYYVEFYN